MIDWKRRALELAEVVNRYHRKTSFHSDIKLAGEMAQELIELGEHEKKVRRKFIESMSHPDKKEREKLYSEYLELIR